MFNDVIDGGKRNCVVIGGVGEVIDVILLVFAVSVFFLCLLMLLVVVVDG